MSRGSQNNYGTSSFLSLSLFVFETAVGLLLLLLSLLRSVAVFAFITFAVTVNANV